MKEQPSKTGKAAPVRPLLTVTDLLSQSLTFTSKVGSTCDLGVQSITLSPGASSCCGSGCSSCSSCCW